MSDLIKKSGGVIGIVWSFIQLACVVFTIVTLLVWTFPKWGKSVRPVFTQTKPVSSGTVPSNEVSQVATVTLSYGLPDVPAMEFKSILQPAAKLIRPVTDNFGDVPTRAYQLLICTDGGAEFDLPAGYYAYVLTREGNYVMVIMPSALDGGKVKIVCAQDQDTKVYYSTAPIQTPTP